MLEPMTAAKATAPTLKRAPKSYLDNVIELVENVCTGCTECSDRDTCACDFDEDLAFEAAEDQQPAEGLRPHALAKRA